MHTAPLPGTNTDMHEVTAKGWAATRQRWSDLTI